MIKRFVSLSTVTAVLLGFASNLPFATAQSTNDTGTLRVVQEHATEGGSLGTWTLIRPGNDRLEVVKKKEYETNVAAAGQYTILVEQPAGASTNIDVYVNGELESENAKPQAAFVMEAGDEVIVDINYKLTRTGTVSVSSDPRGLEFIITGPDDWRKRGVAPESYPNSPIGQYSVTYEPPEECGQPAPKSDKLVKDGRIDFDISLRCDALDDLMQDDNEKKLQYVTVMIDGEDVIFEDVPLNQWFSQHVFKVAKTGVMAGYTQDGKPTGRFGPSDEINMAQLAKIAAELSGIRTADFRGRPDNRLSHGQWFERYFLISEELGWQAFRSPTLDPAKSATRAEVVATLLQALDVPRLWPTADMFTDVAFDTRFASSIETGAGDGLVSGYTNPDGSPTGDFGPDNPVNRAEMAKIVSVAIELYIEESAEITGGSR